MTARRKLETAAICGSAASCLELYRFPQAEREVKRFMDAQSLDDSLHRVINQNPVDCILTTWCDEFAPYIPQHSGYVFLESIKLHNIRLEILCRCSRSFWPAQTSFNRLTSSFQVGSNCTILALSPKHNKGMQES